MIRKLVLFLSNHSRFPEINREKVFSQSTSLQQRSHPQTRDRRYSHRSLRYQPLPPCDFLSISAVQKLISLLCPLILPQPLLPLERQRVAPTHDTREPRAGEARGTLPGQRHSPQPRLGKPRDRLPPFLPRVGHRLRRDGQRDRRDPPFLRSSSSTTWMDSSGSFPGRGLRRRSPIGGGGGGVGPGPREAHRGRAAKDTLQALVGEERAVLRLPHRHGRQPLLLAVGERQRAPGRQLLLPRLAVGLQPAGLRSAPRRGPGPGPGGSAGEPGTPGPA